MLPTIAHVVSRSPRAPTVCHIASTKSCENQDATQRQNGTVSGAVTPDPFPIERAARSGGVPVRHLGRQVCFADAALEVVGEERTGRGDPHRRSIAKRASSTKIGPGERP